MEDITCKINGKKITVYLSGAINSENAFKVEQEVSKLFDKNISSLEEAVIDLENITYISSAGLRFFLHIQKKYRLSIRIIKVRQNVYEIFEMTGLTSIMDITKFYSEVSIAGLEMIGKGYFGDVYKLDDDRIIKVFARLTSKKDLYRERDMGKKAFLYGIPTAISFEIVKVKEGGYGLIYEMIKSQCLNKVIMGDLEHYDKYISMYISLFKNVINTRVEEGKLPNKKTTAKSWYDGLRKYHAFEDRIIDKLEKMMLDLPDTNTMIHGDLHIKNIMIQNGEPILIDMETLGLGHPIFELSAIFLSYYGYPVIDPNNTMEFFGVPIEIAHRIYDAIFNAVFEGRSELEKKEIWKKIELFSYSWLTFKCYEYDPDNKIRLLDSTKRTLDLIDKVDSFSF